jgi:hypothetical protein
MAGFDLLAGLESVVDLGVAKVWRLGVGRVSGRPVTIIWD